MSEERVCTNCIHSASVDNGISNYTVEGTDVHCMRGLNPDMPFDDWYGGNPLDEFALTCNDYEEGDGLQLDVEYSSWVDEIKKNGWVADGWTFEETDWLRRFCGNEVDPV